LAPQKCSSIFWQRELGDLEDLSNNQWNKKLTKEEKALSDKKE
jgi:hypothetical protein